VTFAFSITADAVVVPAAPAPPAPAAVAPRAARVAAAPELAETGVDASSGLLAGLGLLAAGAAAFAVRRLAGAR
jgi:LPXTG-motif cell wall-anchored protein